MNQKDMNMDELMELAVAMIVRTIETEEVEVHKEKEPCMEECVEVIKLVKENSMKKKHNPQDVHLTEKV